MTGTGKAKSSCRKEKENVEYREEECLIKVIVGGGRF